jgi:hypothetical protein
MTKTSTVSARVTVDVIAESLRLQGIEFRGPLYLQKKRTLFFVENQIFLESELTELLAQNKLNREGIQELAKRIEAMNARQ